MSTPEAAYAINRIDRNDPSAWQKVRSRHWRRDSHKGANARPPRPEWAKVLLQARIREVVTNMTRAAVIADCPGIVGQESGSAYRRSFSPIGKSTLAQCWRHRFDRRQAKPHSWSGSSARVRCRTMRDPLAHATEIKAAAAQFFEGFARRTMRISCRIFATASWTPRGGTIPRRACTWFTDYPSFALCAARTSRTTLSSISSLARCSLERSSSSARPAGRITRGCSLFCIGP